MDICEITKCYGCGACASACIQKAIHMEINEEGFLHPYFDLKKCVNCETCKQVCPANVKDIFEAPLAAYGAITTNENELSNSSSGGIFSVLAEYVLKKNGFVCGAVFSEDFKNVYHVVTNDRNTISKMRLSKYVQSDIGACFVKIKELLDRDVDVLFTGCPCQVSGLKKYLRRDYNNLICVDLICHGVPSISAWQKYLGEVSNGRKIENVMFRDKTIDSGSCLSIQYADGSWLKENWRNNYYIRAFLDDIIFNEACVNCRFPHEKRVGDITLGDFWGVEKYSKTLRNLSGCSLVLINTKKGQLLWETVKCRQTVIYEEVDANAVRKSNKPLFQNANRHPGRAYFFENMGKSTFKDNYLQSKLKLYDVGIVGYWYSPNYGAALTSYSLYQAIRRIGFSVVLLDAPCTSPNRKNYLSSDNLARQFVMQYCDVGPIYNTISEYSKLNQLCDKFVCGSDQIWRGREGKQYNQGGYYQLDFADEDKVKIAYATSFGTSSFCGNNYDYEMSKLLLRRFDAISVRETTGIGICNALGVEAVQMPDPVFLISKEEFLEIAQKCPKKGKYIFAYILQPTEYKQQLLTALQKAYNYDLIIVSDLDPNAKQFDGYEEWTLEIKTNVSVEEWLGYIEKADIVITDSFHGYCFSLIFGRKFLGLMPRDTKARFDTLADITGTSELVLFEGAVDDAIRLLEYHEIDFEKISRILEGEKLRGSKWLREMLGISKTRTEIDIITNFERNRTDEKIYITRNELLGIIRSQKEQLNHLLEMIKNQNDQMNQFQKKLVYNQRQLYMVKKMAFVTFLNSLVGGKDIAIKGAGVHTEEILKIMPETTHVKVILDKNPQKSDMFGIPVRLDSYLPDYEVDAILISSLQHADQMILDIKKITDSVPVIDVYQELQNMGIEFKNEFYRNV